VALDTIEQTNKKLPVYFLNIIFDVDILKVLINLKNKVKFLGID
jgi:hypothetical protein